jgi:hypothetical protein
LVAIASNAKWRKKADKRPKKAFLFFLSLLGVLVVDLALHDNLLSDGLMVLRVEEGGQIRLCWASDLSLEALSGHSLVDLEC